jgi:hypothetical protein
MILPIVVAAYLMGMMVFLVKAAFSIEIWEYCFYLWDKSVGGGFLVWYLIAKYSRQRRLVIPVMWLAFARFLWEIVSLVFSIHINNPWGIMGLFMAFTITATYACLRRNSRISGFLDKNSP